jgi:hypothetical protein
MANGILAGPLELNNNSAGWMAKGMGPGYVMLREVRLIKRAPPAIPAATAIRGAPAFNRK